MAEQKPVSTRVPHVFEDPQAEAIAETYAEAFLNAAGGIGVENALEEFRSFLDDVLERNPDFKTVLLSGIVGRDEKIDLINRVVAPFATPVFTNFLRVLARHDRLDLLPVIFRESQLLHEARSGRQRVQVVSARPLSDEMRERIRTQLAAMLPFDPILETQVDPSLIGGLIIRIGDTVYDSSLRTRLKQLRTRMRERSLNEIQSGRNRFSYSA